jgi:hypothetical protein
LKIAAAPGTRGLPRQQPRILPRARFPGTPSPNALETG